MNSHLWLNLQLNACCFRMIQSPTVDAGDTHRSYICLRKLPVLIHHYRCMYIRNYRSVSLYYYSRIGIVTHVPDLPSRLSKHAHFYPEFPEALP